MPDTPASPTLLQRAVLWILHALMFYVVVLYPVLLMARFQPDDVVHYGFLRWIAVVLVLYWAALQLFFTERPADTRPGRQTLAVTAGILLVLGTFTPIVSFPFVGDVDFFREGYGDGYILLAMAGLSMALAVTGRWKQVLVPGLGSLAVVLWTFLGVQDTISQARSGAQATLAGNPHQGLAASVMQSIQWEWGWLLLFAGSGLLVYSAARKDELESGPSPFVPAPVEEQAEGAPSEVPAAATVEEPASTPSEPAAEESAVESAEATGEQAEASDEAEAAADSAAHAPAAETEEEPAAPAAEAVVDAATEQPEGPTAESAAAEEPTVAATAGQTPAQGPVDAENEVVGAAAEAAPAPDSAPAESDGQASADASGESDQASAEAPGTAPSETAASASDAPDESDSGSTSAAKKE